jgi:hypothetical protein
MKKIIYKKLIYRILFSCMAAVLILMPACKKDNLNLPVIREIRNYAASPNDTIVNIVGTGQWLVLMGENLGGVSQVYFGGIPATINSTLSTDGSLVVQVPVIPISASYVNEITVVNGSGSTTYQINVAGVPVISYIRSSEASPNDVILDTLLPGMGINMVGYDFENATSITVQGVEISLNNVVHTDTSVILNVPVDLSGSSASLANKISLTTRYGTATFGIRIIGPPIITGISFEIPSAGDLVYLYGLNFVNIQNITFAGATVTDFDVLSDSVISITSPALSQSGPVAITTLSGTGTTAYKVNDIAYINAGGLGILANLEWGDYFGYQWWGGGILNSNDPASGWPPYNSDFVGGFGGMYIELKSDALAGNAGDDGNAIRIGDYAWVPTENLNDPGANWALKFEMNVKNPWNGGTICIKSSNGDYIAKYQPWKISSTVSVPFTTNGWKKTVSIPLSAFCLSDGTPITKVSDLLNISTGKGNLTVYLHNYSSSTAATSFDAGFDNFRITRR